MANGDQLAISGIEKASTLLIVLGTAASSAILKHLTPTEIEQVSTQIARLKALTPDQRQMILQEFRSACEHGSVESIGGPTYVADLLKQALGEQKGTELAARLMGDLRPQAFEWLAACDPSEIAKVLSTEMPQTIALVIVHLPSEKSAAALSALPPALQGKVALRIASMGDWSSDMIGQIDGILREKLSTGKTASYKALSGTKALVEMLRYAPRSTERVIMDSLVEGDPTVAEEVKSLMFVFEDIVTLDDKVVQAMLREVEQEDLRLALKGAPDNIRDLLFRNLSERAAEALKEDMELLGAVRRRDVEVAQQKIVAVLRKMEERGDVILRASAEEEETLIE